MTTPDETPPPPAAPAAATNPRRIAFIDSEPKKIELTETFGTAAGKQEVAANTFVTVRLVDGSTGTGEAAPFEAINGETNEAVLAGIGQIAPRILGVNAIQWRYISGRLEEILPWPVAARAALEQAILDATATHLGVPLWALFGGEGGELETDMTITTGSIEHAKKSAQAIAERGIKSLKIKVGKLDVDDDVERVRAAVEVMPNAQILLDGNCGLTAESTLDLLTKLRSHGVHITLVEQPVPADDLDGMAKLVREADTIICADESAKTPADVIELIRRRAATAINIKIMKSGVIRAWDMALIARAAGLDLMIGGMVESIVAMNFSANMAFGIGGFRFVDLDTPFFMKETLHTGGYTVKDGRINLARGVKGSGIKRIAEPEAPAAAEPKAG